MGEQSIRAFQQASSLRGMPVNLIGVAISTAFFPKLSEEAGLNHEETYRNTLRSAYRTIIWISLPVAIVAFFIRGYVVNFIKNGGDPKIASVLAAFVIAIFCQSLYHIVARGYYAKQNTRTPLIISIVAFIVQVIFAVGFSVLELGPEGLAYATSISAIFEVGVLAILQNRDMGRKLFDFKFWVAMGKILVASVLTGVVAYIMTKLLPLRAVDNSFLATFPKFLAITAVTAIFYIIICSVLRIEEVKPVIQKINDALFKNIKRQ
jgi:putative peptidoglycan lipid II flippase